MRGKSHEETAMRSRNISWKVRVDEMAQKLAKERHISVSRLLECLVIVEASHAKLGKEEA